jgi:hypothetical protein
MPLTLSRFRTDAATDYSGCGGCMRSAVGVVKGRHTYLVRMWVGSQASPDDKRELEQLVQTLRFSQPNGA